MYHVYAMTPWCSNQTPLVLAIFVSMTQRSCLYEIGIFVFGLTIEDSILHIVQVGGDFARYSP